MIIVERLYKKTKIFQRLTGLTPDKFQGLLNQLEPLFIESELKRKKTTDRKRKTGGGRKQKLSLAQGLFMLLLYYRSYSSHMSLSFMMGIDDSSVCHYFKRIEPLLAKIFRIPERKVILSEDEIDELIFDATEQDSERRDGSGYSGKKKRQTIKTQIVVTPNGRIKSVSKTAPGNVHDKKLYDNTKVFTLIKVKRKADLGYVGTSCLAPIKKQKNRPLTEQERDYNRKFSSFRIVIEHAIAHLKKFGILAQRFRNSIKSYYLIFKNIAGLRNLQMT